MLRVAATGALAGGALVAMAADGGAYFPPSWGWAGLLFLGAVALVLLLAHDVALSWLELAFLAALAAFVAWVGFSAIWSESVTRTVLELERDLVYVAAAAALLLVARPGSSRWMLGAVPVAGAVVCAWSLATRESSGVRLIGPIGYWNALGLFAALGTIVALGFAVEGTHRSIAAAACVPCVATLYLTYSRGASLALAAGVGVTLALSPRRLTLAGTATLLAAPCAAAAALAARSEGVGFRLALALLALLAAAVAPAVDWIAARVNVPARTRRAVGIAAAVAAAAIVAVAVIRSGGLGATASRTYRSFTGPAPTSGKHGRTLLSVSSAGRAEYWQVAWRDFRDHPIAGSGAGTFALAWDRDRHTIYDVLDAHSLYAEALGELGVVGGLLAAVALGLPLLALRRVRTQPLVAAAAGAYAAFLLHAGLDWDWEMPALTIAGLTCACTLLVAARRDALELSLGVRAAALAATGLAAAFVAFTYAGNRDLAHANAAYDAGGYPVAVDGARRAAHILRWSADPWHLRADAELAEGLRSPAHESYRRARDLDPNDWRLWYGVGITARGEERRAALARAAVLNPLAREILALPK